jgi:multisubunit Na+/H+ antiporter MnhC subunit
MFGYVLLARPFKDSFDQCTAIVTEAGNLLIFLAAGLYAFDLGESMSADVEAVAVVIVLGAIVVSAALSLLRTVMMLVTLVKLYQSSKGRVGVKETFQVKGRKRVLPSLESLG